MEKEFEFLDHMSDVYVAAYGRSLEEAFENAGKAFTHTITNVRNIRPVEEREIRVKGMDLEELLYNWLDELLFVFEVENLLFSDFSVRIFKKNEGYELVAAAKGEKYDPNKHVQKVAVKSPTYSLMEIAKKNETYVLKFVLDI